MSIEGMAERAVELREKGLSTREICQELHLGQTTVEWLLAKQASEPEDQPPADVKAGWRSIGVSGLRIRDGALLEGTMEPALPCSLEAKAVPPLCLRAVP